MRRIGIYSGTFDPVHTGHIAFALQAIAAAKLDKVYFMPERQPRRKTGVTHYGHRWAMLARAVRPHSALAVLDVVGRNFSVKQTLPALRRVFGDAQLVFLLGSDVVSQLAQWDHIDVLASEVEFCVGVRKNDKVTEIMQVFQDLGIPCNHVHIVDSFAANVSSTIVRDALKRDCYTFGVLTSVYKYAQKNRLYL